MSGTEVWASWVFLEAPVENASLVSLPASRGRPEILAAALFCRSHPSCLSCPPTVSPSCVSMGLSFLTWTLPHISWSSHGGFPHGCQGLPRAVLGKEPACQHRRHKSHGFSPWVRKTPWRRAWQRTPAFLSGGSYGHRSLAGCSPWGHKELDTAEKLNRCTRTCV